MKFTEEDKQIYAKLDEHKDDRHTMYIKGPDPDPNIDTSDDGVTGGVYAILFIVGCLLLGLF